MSQKDDEQRAGGDDFLNHVLDVMARASVGDITARVNIPKDMDTDSIGYRLSAGLNVLLSDLEAQHRNKIAKLAQEAIAQSEEVRMIVTETQEMVSELRERNHRKTK